MSSTYDINLLNRALQPMVRSSFTLIRQEVPLKEMIVLQNEDCGSYIGGIPFAERDEQYPVCKHGIPMNFLFQIDTRHALPQTPHVLGLYVVFAPSLHCMMRKLQDHNETACVPTIRFYSNPGKRFIKKDDDCEDDYSEVLKPGRLFESLPQQSDLIKVFAPDVFQQIVNLPLSESWEHVYYHLTHQGGAYDQNLFSDHSGGWYATYSGTSYIPPVCPHCHEFPHLVCQLDGGDSSHSLWSCPAHHSYAHYALHK